MGTGNWEANKVGLESVAGGFQYSLCSLATLREDGELPQDFQ